MNACPQCLRRLLSQSSTRCNWCGKIIENQDYQANAYSEREAYFTHQAQHDAQSLANISAVNLNPYDTELRQRVLGTQSHMPTYQNKAAALADQERFQDMAISLEMGNCQNELSDENPTQGRFRHLEW